MTHFHCSLALPALASRRCRAPWAIRAFRALWDRLRSARAARRAALELAGMDDRLLLDLGISRTEIQAVAQGCTSRYASAVLGQREGEQR